MKINNYLVQVTLPLILYIYYNKNYLMTVQIPNPKSPNPSASKPLILIHQYPHQTTQTSAIPNIPPSSYIPPNPSLPSRTKIVPKLKFHYLIFNLPFKNFSARSLPTRPSTFTFRADNSSST